MDIHSWIMDKSITESNQIYESYLTLLFSYVSPTIRVMYLFRYEIMKNVTYKFEVTLIKV